jgi:hypothetical protein
MARNIAGASGAIIRKSFLIVVVVAVLGVSPGGFAR